MKQPHIEKMKEAIKSCRAKGINPVLLAQHVSKEEAEKAKVRYKNERLEDVERNIKKFLKERPDLPRND